MVDDMAILKQSGYHFALSRRIMGNDGFTGAIIYGKQRIGKSSYAMQIGYDIYKDWNDVAKYTFFKLDDLISFLKDLTAKHGYIPYMIVDDAGVHLSKHTYYSNRTDAQFLSNLFDVVGVAVKSIIFTTPDPGNILKAIRRYEFMRVKIIKQTNYRRLAKGYRNIMLPSGTFRIRTDFIDSYKVKLPDEIYKDYSKVRWGYLEEVMSNFDKKRSKGKQLPQIEGLQEANEEVF